MPECLCCCCVPNQIAVFGQYGSVGPCPPGSAFFGTLTYDPTLSAGVGGCWRGDITVHCGGGSAGACTEDRLFEFVLCCLDPSGGAPGTQCAGFTLTVTHTNALGSASTTRSVQMCTCDPFLLEWLNFIPPFNSGCTIWDKITMTP